MKRTKRTIMALSVAGMLMSSAAFATNGYFAHGYSTKEKGMAGAGVAYSQDALASATNPAGMVRVGDRFDVGLALFSPKREYTVGAPAGGPGMLVPGTQESSNEIFAIPHIGVNWMLDDISSIGIAAYGNGGMNTEYKSVPSVFAGLPPQYGGNPDAKGTFGAGVAGVNLMQLFVNVSYARQLDSANSVGISAVGAIQKFKATGLGTFGNFGMSNDPANLTNNDHDTSRGLGWKLGWQGSVSDVMFGASYQSEINMSKFNDYAGLFANGGEFNIPATSTIGLAWKTSATTTLVLDVQKIYYSDVDSIANGVGNLQLPDGSGRLGGRHGAGFGWEDMTIVKAGYEFGSTTKYRVGVSHGKQPIGEGQTMFNILAPAVMETHITAGFTTPLSDSSELSVAAMYAPSKTISGPTATPLGMQDVSLEMEQTEIQATYSLLF